MAQTRQAGEQLFTRGSAGQVRLGIWIELVTIAWMTIEASIAIVTGYITRSVSLQGFGIDSVIELIAGGVLLWRLLVEQRGGTTGAIEQAERSAAWMPRAVPPAPIWHLHSSPVCFSTGSSAGGGPIL